MANIKDQLQNDLKEAMKNKDNFKRDTIRFLMSALKQVEVDERKVLENSDIVKIIQKSLKQREDSASQYKDAGREDLCEKEQQEATILKNYLPKQLEDSELKNIIEKLIEKEGCTSIKEIGKIMTLCMQACEGRADGKRINAIAKELLS
ncbi:MAG: GatB/YqeY domain-containing protein [Sulfurospirillaceae bacterium]|nr:GatB/YqeY domain-containing protein [Sulfurospirillaceae bacterium]